MTKSQISSLISKILMGQHLSALRQLVAKKRYWWIKYVSKSFPHISLKTIESAFELRGINRKISKNLAAAGETRLIKLLKM